MRRWRFFCLKITLKMLSPLHICSLSPTLIKSTIVVLSKNEVVSVQFKAHSTLDRPKKRKWTMSYVLFSTKPTAEMQTKWEFYLSCSKQHLALFTHSEKTNWIWIKPIMLKWWRQTYIMDTVTEMQWWSLDLGEQKNIEKYIFYQLV